MAKSIKKNFSWNLLLTVCGYLFPLIAYPYSSRVLGVENIGICNFVDSIVNFFVLFSALGVGSLGVREIARCKDDLEKRSRVFTNLLVFNMSLTAVMVTLLITLTLTVPRLQPYQEFLAVGVLKLVFMPLSVEWFFQGIQEFKYITLRTLIFKLISIILLFALVHDRQDVLWYYSLNVITAFLSAVVNLRYARNFVRFTFTGYRPLAFIAPILSFGYYRILTSLYTTFNAFFLGMTSGDVEVGYFSTASKITALVMSVFTALTTVMVPKVAEMLSEGRKGELQQMADSIFSVLTAMALPIIVLCISCAPAIITLIAGPGYEGAIPAFRVIVFLILIIGIEQIVIQQFLMASKNTRTIVIVSTTGAVVGLTSNFLLTPVLHSLGTSLSWAMSEFSVLVCGLFLLRKYLGIRLSFGSLVGDAVCSVLYVIPILAIHLLIDSQLVSLILSAIMSGMVFMLINCMLKPNRLIINIFNRIAYGRKKRQDIHSNGNI